MHIEDLYRRIDYGQLSWTSVTCKTDSGNGR